MPGEGEIDRTGATGMLGRDVQVRLSPAGAGAIRFASGVSPLWEVTLALRLLTWTLTPLAGYQPWKRQVGWSSPDPRVECLLPLVSGSVGVPFLTPTLAPNATLDELLASVADTPAAAIQEQVEFARVVANPAFLTVMALPEHRLAEAFASALEAAYEALVEPWSAQMNAVLREDLAWYAKQVASLGSYAVLSTLGDGVRVNGHEIRLRHKHTPEQRPDLGPDWPVVDVDERGVRLLPTVMANGLTTLLPAPEGLPVLVFHTRSWGRVFEPDGVAVLPELERLLGASRSAILLACQRPTTTKALAIRLALAPASVSAHLGVLTSTGLLERDRSGRHVYYQQTDHARKWLDSLG